MCQTKDICGLFAKLILNLASELGAKWAGVELGLLGARMGQRRTWVGASWADAEPFSPSGGKIAWRRAAQLRRQPI